MMASERRFSKVYFEITNACNASCSFCPGHSRPIHFVNQTEFKTVIEKLKGRADYLYFHLMGEPLLHPEIRQFAKIAADNGFKVSITSNGILSKSSGIELIKDGKTYKISLSLHSYEANRFGMTLDEYLGGCFEIAEKSKEVGTICVFRLWNIKSNSFDNDVENCRNDEIIQKIKEHFYDEWVATRSGFRISDHIFLEFGERFLWPGEAENKSEVFCYGLRTQIGILSDGTVVPCCLDAEGKMALGNIYSQSLDDILSSVRAEAIYDSFTSHRACEHLCKTCGFARRFSV